VNAPVPSYGTTNGGQGKPFGKVERVIARRYLGAKKSEGGVALIAALSFICIMLAIWAMITIMSIMNGFRAQMIELTIGSQGHMYVASSAAQPSIESVEALEGRLSTIPGVTKAFQFMQNMTAIQANGQPAGAQVVGISAEDLLSFDLIANNIVYGGLAGFGEGAGSDHQVVMGARLASSLGLTVGDKFRMLSGRSRTSVLGGNQPIFKTYTIGALFEVGLLEADQTYIYMDMEQAMLFFEGGKTPGTIQLRLEDPDNIDEVAGLAMEVAGEPIFIQTWRDKNSATATALRTEQIAMRFIFSIVVIIATFPILAAMIMLVKNKSKDIAILRTIGATRAGILRIFLMAGSMIGVLGTLVGLLIGLLFCLNIEFVQSVIEFFTGPLFPPEVYQIGNGQIPVKIIWSEVISVSLLGFLISALATFLPAWTASRIDPVEALRYE